MHTPRAFHFISGLPRSGSTLLAALLLQNPRFHAGMSSPVGMLFQTLLDELNSHGELGPNVDRAQRRRLLRGVFDSYYADLTDKPVVFDTSRAWSARLPAVLDLFPQSRLIACVRNVAWVMDSLERLVHADPYENTRLFSNEHERSNVYSRVDALAQRNRLVGYAWSALKEAYYGEHAASVLVVDYDLLAQAPERVLKLVYEFIGQPWFDGHDFERVHYDAPEFDEALGLSGLHKVRPKVRAERRRTVLPPDLFDKCAALSFWQDGTGSAASVIKAHGRVETSGEAS